MQLTSVKLSNFRLIEHLEFTPDPGINLIVGPNASGKTSILEAIFYGCTAKSFRGAGDDVLLQQGAEVCRIELTGTIQTNPITVEIAFGKGAKRQVKVDGVKLTRLADLFDYFHAVSFIPEDTELIFGPPAARRRMLDLYLSQADRYYLSELLEYNRILAQRNALLKSFDIADEDSEASLTLLDTWDEQIAKVGAQLLGKRLAMLAGTTGLLEKYYFAIAGGSASLRWAYESSLPADATSIEVYRSRLAATRKRDLYFGSTGIGPHRDDVAITLGDKPTRDYASQGEAKSAALAIKFAIFAFLNERLHAPPLLLLDEFASDLDRNRLTALLETLPHLGQVFLTSARPSDVPATALIKAQIAIVEGKLAV